MTKREIMIDNLIKLERAKLEKLTDEALMQRVTAILDCTYCPAFASNHCVHYQTCDESIISWYKGGNDDNDNT